MIHSIAVETQHTTPTLHSSVQHLIAVCFLQSAVNHVVDGLFCTLIALGTVPIIKCPKVSINK